MIEIAHNINKVFGQGTVNKCTTQNWFKKFYNNDKGLGDQESHRYPAIDN